MRKTIRRKMTTSTISTFSTAIVDGKPETKQLEPITVLGKIKESAAVKEVKKVYPDEKAVIIGNIAESETVYEISVDEFVKHAKKIENN